MATNKQAEDDGWKKHHPKMISAMSLEKLREALKRQERPMLERALQECLDRDIDPKHSEIVQAQRMVHALKDKEKLREAMETRDADAIDAEAKRISENLSSYQRLQREVQEARSLSCNLRREQKLNKERHVLEMDKNTMSELRRYHNPPQCVKRVMQAALLLLREDEGKTEDWRECQKMCNPQGRCGLNRRIMEFDVSLVHREIVARVREILQDLQLSSVQAVSSGAGTFYVWAMGAVEETKLTADDQPASKNRQREIFDPPVASPQRARKKYKLT